MRWILAEDEPDIVGYDQDRWVDGLRHRDDDPDELIALFEALRDGEPAAVGATPAADRERFGRHRERGPESYGLIVRLRRPRPIPPGPGGTGARGGPRRLTAARRRVRRGLARVAGAAHRGR